MTEGNPHNWEKATKVTCKEDSENKPLTQLNFRSYLKFIWYSRYHLF